MSPERVDPGRDRLDDEDDAEGRSAAITPACTQRAAELYRRAIDTVHERLDARGGRADEAAREHLPLGQHRARQRARASSATGWGSTSGRSSTPPRRSRSASCRFSPGPGLGGHCIPIDPFYLSWKAREFGFYTEFIELAGKVNEEMPYFCRSLVSQALNHARAARDEGLADPRARRRVQAGHRRHARVAGAEAHLAAAERRRRGLVPRPARPAVREQGVELSSVAYEPQRLRLRRDRHRPLRRSTTTGSSTTRRSSSTSATRPARRASRRRTSSSCERRLSRRPGGARLLGPEPRAQLRRARRPPLALRRERGAARGVRRALPRRDGDRRLRRAARRPTSSTPS